MSTFDEELTNAIAKFARNEYMSADETAREIKALIKKHQPEKLVRPSKYGKLYCPHCAKESMIHFPTVGDDYNQALADSDKAYGLWDKEA